MTDAGVELRADRRRVVAKLYLPGETMPGSPSRTEAIVERVLAAPADEVTAAAAEILTTFGPRDDELGLLLKSNASLVKANSDGVLSPDQVIVLGATFTSEYTVFALKVCT